MGTQKLIMMIAVIVGLFFVIAAVLYFTQPASALPAFLPGHEAGLATKHAKHGLLALALAIACFLVAWFQSGPKTDAPK